MKEIKIYGEIVPFQDAWLEESGFCNLSIIQRQLKESNGEDVNIRINSYGGDVDEGFAIYSEIRRYAKDNKANITTTAEGRCASIATVIFLAGDKRVVNPYVEPFVHNAWTYAIGDAKQVQRIATDLDKCNQKIAEHYALHTDLTKDEALALMDAETSITPDECIKIRFATEKEEIFRPVALKKILNKSNKPEMSKKDKKGIWNKIQGWLKEEGILNKVVFDAEQNEIDFYELSEDDSITVGAKARVDGEDASGEYVVPSEENPDVSSTYVFTDGELTEIKEEEAAEEEEETTEEENSELAALKTENENLKTQLAEVNNKVTEKDTVINNLKEKNKSLKAVVNKIKALESDEKIVNEKEKEQKPETKSNKSKASQAIANLKNNK